VSIFNDTIRYLKNVWTFLEANISREAATIILVIRGVRCRGENFIVYADVIQSLNVCWNCSVTLKVCHCGPLLCTATVTENFQITFWLNMHSVNLKTA